MTFFKQALLLALLVEASLAAAASNEGDYLTNCDEFEPGKLFSEMDYYSNAKSGSQSGQKPQVSTVFDSSDYVTWEGGQVCGTFSSSGDTFCSNIVSNGVSLATGAYAGYGYNDETNFNCYKDNGRSLFTSVGIICNSIYCCDDAAPKFQGKISRILAAKSALSIRLDALGEGGEATVGVEDRLKVEVRLRQFEGPPAKKQKKGWEDSEVEGIGEQLSTISLDSVSSGAYKSANVNLRSLSRTKYVFWEDWAFKPTKSVWQSRSRCVGSGRTEAVETVCKKED